MESFRDAWTASQPAPSKPAASAVGSSVLCPAVPVTSPKREGAQYRPSWRHPECTASDWAAPALSVHSQAGSQGQWEPAQPKASTGPSGERLIETL